MSGITQSLIIGGLGLGITFAALTVILLLIRLLTRVFEPKKDLAVVESAETALSEEEEVAVAIAIALSRMRAGGHGRNGLGAALENGRGAWWRPGRTRRPAMTRRAQ